jgi:hypothetical protein
MERMYFPHSTVYHTWYEDFSGVVEIQNTCVDNYPSPSVAPYGVNFRPGSRLVKVQISNSVYAVLPNNTIAKIATAEVAEDLYGANWGTLVRDIADPFWPNYVNMEAEITSAALHDGMLVRTSGSGITYHVEDGMLSEVDGDLNFLASDVRTVSDTLLDAVENSFDTVTMASIVADPSQLGGGSGQATPPVPAGNLTIALAADTPAADYVYKNSTHAGFTKVNLTSGSDAVTIDSMVVERTGAPASDDAFTGVNVILEDGSLLNSTYKAFNSDHQATFTNDVVIPANTTVSILLAGKMANVSTYSGEVPTLSLASINTNATVNGSLPIEGNPMTINTTVTIGVATVSESPDLGTLTEEVGTENVEFLNVKIANDSANNIDLDLESIRFNNVGSADDSDIDNVELVVDGNVIATSEMVANYVIFDLSGCGGVCTILNGKNETFQLRGDIVGGSGRTIDFDVKTADDIRVRDLLNNAYVTPSAAINSGRTITVSRGTLNVSKTNTVQSTNIPEDSDDVEFGSWNFRVAGEPITISSLNLHIDVTGDVQAADFTNMRLVDANGDAFTGTFDGVGAGDGSVTTTDSFTLPIGDNEVILVGSLNDDASSDDTVQFSVDLSYEAGLDATGDVTGDAITLETATAYAFPNARVTANLQTITDISLSVTTLPQPAAQTIAGGTSDHLYATVRFDASNSSENIKVTAFEFSIVTNGTAKTNEVQNITFVVGDQTLGTTKDGSVATVGTDEEVSVSLSGSDQFVIAAGTAENMYIYADLTAGATAGGSHRIDITSTEGNAVTAQGVTTGNTVTPSYSAAQSGVMTVGTAGGNMEVSLATDTKIASLMAAGTTVDLAAFKFYATSTEDVELDYLYLTQVVTDTNSSSFKDYDQIWFVDEDGVEITGTRMTPTSTVPYINFADNAFVVDHTDTNGEVIYLKAKLAAIGTAANGVASHALGYKINAAANITAKGDLSGNAASQYLSGSAAPTGKTHYVYKGYPTFAKINLTENLANGTNDLFKFTVSAVNNEIGLYKFTFDVATTGVTVSNLYVYDVTDTNNETLLNDTAGTATLGLFETTGEDWTTNYASKEVTVGSGETRTFVLRGDVAGAASGDSVTVKLAGDAAYLVGTNTLMLAAATADGDANDDFIWSDKSAGAHGATTADWTNGFLIPGLASTSSTAELTSL